MEFLLLKERPEFYFLEVSVQVQENGNLGLKKEIFKNCVVAGIESIYGEFATCIPIDIVVYNSSSGRGVLRCPFFFYKRLRAALTLTGECQNRRCCFTVHRVSGKNWSIPENIL